MSWQLRIARPGLRVQMDLTRTLLFCYRDIALSPDCPVGKKRKQWKKVEPWNGLRMVPETVSTVSTCQKLFLPVISPKKKFRNYFSNLRTWIQKTTSATGHGGGVQGQQGNIQRRRPFYHIVYSGETVKTCQKQWKYCIMQGKSAGFIKPAHVRKMYSRSHVSWTMQHLSKGITPLRAFALTSWYKAHTWLLVTC